MSTYRKEWNCCGSVTETEAWEPESCPFCTDDAAPLRKDAERYRWLRAQCDSVTNLVQYRRGSAHNTIPCHTAGYMDLAIDRAMATEPAVGAA